MNPMQFFVGKVMPFRIKKKVVVEKPIQIQDQAFIKEQRDEKRRLAAYELEREAKRIMNAHNY